VKEKDGNDEDVAAEETESDAGGIVVAAGA